MFDARLFTPMSTGRIARMGSIFGLLLSVVAIATAVPGTALAIDEDEDDFIGSIEEIVVTSEKRESTSQDTALALSAFDENALDRENIDDALDIQFSVPNLLYSKGNFTGANLSIRGIGNNAVAASSDAGAGVHFNGFYQVASSLFESEFYDVARVEILRGPQGTLYGRNTTAGVVNVIPNKPANEFKASGEMEFGDYRTFKYKSTVNLPITDWFQVRSSLFRLKRDGYVTNLATGNQVDDRDVVAGRFGFRLGGEADSPAELNVFYDHFLETDKRLRQNKQVCHTDPSPMWLNLGCLPGQSLYEDDSRFGGPDYRGTLTGIIGAASLGGIFNQGEQIARSYNPDNLRQINAVIDPYYKVRNTMGTVEGKWDMGAFEFNLVSGRHKRLYSSNNDYNGVLGYYPEAPEGEQYGPIPFVQPVVDALNRPIVQGAFDAAITGLKGAVATLPDGDVKAGLEARLLGLEQLETGFRTGLIPINDRTLITAMQSISAPLADSLANGTLFTSDPVLTGNGQSTNGHKGIFGWDWSYGNSENESSEVRMLTDFGGVFNFMVGAFELDYESSGWYDVHSNILAYASTAAPYEILADGTPGQYLGHYRNNTRLYELDSEAEFIELYLGNEKAMLTLGGRSTQETKRTLARQTLLNNPTLPFIPGISGRACLGSPAGGWRVAGWGSGGCGNNPVPNFADRQNSWDEDTWKVGLDFQMSEGSLMYITRASSYKSGGLNPESSTGAFRNTFDPEYIESLEIGFKNSIAGKANVNLTFFHYDYQGLQVSKIVDRTSVNENVDATNTGAELEIAWAPTRNWRFDLTASRLQTEIQGGRSINLADPGNIYSDGNPLNNRFLNFKNTDASVYLVEPWAVGVEGAFGGTVDNLNQLMAGARSLGLYVFSPDDCGTYMASEGGWLECTNLFTNSIEATFADACKAADACVLSDSVGDEVRQWLATLSADQIGELEAALPETAYSQAPIGIAVDLTGNQLPNAPEKSARLGVQYNIDLDGTNLGLRADYYWQSDFYYRIFNTEQDLIRAWNVINVQASLTSLTGDWTMELWIKNLRDSDFVTGAYFTDASSGNFTNLFLLEPRTIGVSFKLRY